MADEGAEHSPRGSGEDGAADKAPSVATTIQLLTFAGVVLYASLSVGYQRFYQTLGLSPEDLGVGQGFVLVRAVAFLPLLALLSPVAILGRRPERSWVPFIATTGSSLVAMLVLVAVSIVRYEAAIVAMVLFGSVFFAVSSPAGTVTRAVRVGVLLTGVTVAFSYMSYAAAAVRADDALRGDVVAPAEFPFFPVAILDVSVQRATVTWVGPVAQRPLSLFPDASRPTVDVGYVGENGTTVFAIADNHSVLRLPVANVVVSVTGP